MNTVSYSRTVLVAYLLCVLGLVGVNSGAGCDDGLPTCLPVPPCLLAYSPVLPECHTFPNAVIMDLMCAPPILAAACPVVTCSVPASPPASPSSPVPATLQSLPSISKPAFLSASFHHFCPLPPQSLQYFNPLPASCILSFLPPIPSSLPLPPQSLQHFNTFPT